MGGKLGYNPKNGQICLVRQLKDYQENGIGTKVLNHILADLKQNGLTMCWTVTQTDPYAGDFSGPFFLAKKLGAQLNIPVHPNVNGDGFSLEISDEDYPRLNQINLLPEIDYLDMDLHQYYTPDYLEISQIISIEEYGLSTKRKSPKNEGTLSQTND